MLKKTSNSNLPTSSCIYVAGTKSGNREFIDVVLTRGKKGRNINPNRTLAQVRFNPGMPDGVF